ncbi:hypothetical protein DL93DRAFT_163135 [Clavulina sp. PMI_390]|nr:hypothetical protein DL93DRAFT_163135 [Clavulina sp. PMI_390]
MGLMIYSFQPRWTLPKFANTTPKRPVCAGTYGLAPLHTDATIIGSIDCRCEPTPVFEPPMYVIEEFEEEEAPAATETMTPGPHSPDKSASTNASSIPPVNPQDTVPERRSESKPIQMAYQPAQPTPSPFPSPFVRPGEDDFRMATISYRLRRENQEVIRIIGFTAISELFQDARERQAAAAKASFAEASGSPNEGQSAHPTPLSRHPPTFHPDVIPSRFVVPWKSWGPRWTRFLEGALSRSWICYLYLNRFVFMMPSAPMDAADDIEDDEDNPRPYICILDFNERTFHPSYPARLGRAWDPNRAPPSASTEPAAAPRLPKRATSWDSDDDDDSVSEEEQLSLEGSTEPPTFKEHIQINGTGIYLKESEMVFEENLYTTLSYRNMHMYKPLEGRWWVPMIDAERILLVPVSSFFSPSSVMGSLMLIDRRTTVLTTPTIRK